MIEYKGKSLRSILGKDYLDTYILNEKLLFEETGLIFDGDDYVYCPGYKIDEDSGVEKRYYCQR